MPASTACPGDEEILTAIRVLQEGGGRDAFTVIFRRYYPPLHTFFANRPMLREEADDLAQATLLHVYENIGRFQPGSNFEAWLWKIGQNLWINAIRARRTAKRDAILEPLEEAEAPRAGRPRSRATPALEVPSPEKAVLVEERARVLREAIEALPQGMRLCTELRLYGELKYREIANATGIGLNSVRSQLFEARKRLQPVLNKYFQDADF